MTRRLLWPAIGLLLLLALVAVPLWRHSRPASSGQAMAKVSIGIQASPAMALVMVAKDEGLFEREGVDVDIKQFSAGKFALQAMMGGSVDFAVAGEVPVGLATMQGNPLRVYTQVVRTTSNEVRMVARAPVGQDPKNFFSERKRRLATSLGGGPEFFTWSYLRAIGVSAAQVEIVGQKPEDMPAALASGSVDAVAVFDPFAYIAERKAAGAAHAFPDIGAYSELYVLASRPAIGDSKAVEIAAMVRALGAAQRAIAQNPARAKVIVQRYTGLDQATLDGIWKNFDFAPALTPKLLDYWGRQFVWAKETGKIKPDAQQPNFGAILDRRPLAALDGASKPR